jgi:hypothetical protein
MVNPQSLEERKVYLIRVNMALTGLDTEKSKICEFQVIDNKFVVDGAQLSNVPGRIPAVELSPLHLAQTDSEDQAPFFYKVPLTIPDQVV